MQDRNSTLPRFLTQHHKRVILGGWLKAIDGFERHTPDGELGGKGYPDVEMFDWCKKINAFEDMCTLQSCAGHRRYADDETSRLYDTGCLWIWLSSRLSNRFHKSAYLLALRPEMESVATRYAGWGQEFAEIRFDGMNLGQSSLDDSMTEILVFLTRLSVPGINALKPIGGPR